jgi:hypothetical protein
MFDDIMFLKSFKVDDGNENGEENDEREERETRDVRRENGAVRD